MTYSTGNPVGSNDPRDLKDNAENFDDALNGPGLTWTDRKGLTRQSYKGLEEAASGIPAVEASRVAVAAAESASADEESAAASAVTATAAKDVATQKAADASASSGRAITAETNSGASATSAGQSRDAAAESKRQAGLSESSAGTSAGTATTGATTSTANAAQALASSNAAAAARDAAQLSAGIYATTAAGITATNSNTNKYFSVPSANSAEYLILYLNASGAAVYQQTYPSASSVLALGVVLTPIASVVKPQSTKRAGWYGAQVDKFNRILTAIKSTTNARHHFIAQVFEAPVTVKSATLGSRTTNYGADTVRGGYIWSTVDKFKRIIFGQRIDGSIWAWGVRLLTFTDRTQLEALIAATTTAPSFTSVKYDTEPVAYKRSNSRTGWMWGKVDKLKRVYFGMKIDGSLWAWGNRILTSADRAALEALIASSVPAVTMNVYGAVDATGNKQVFVRGVVSGMIRRLSTAGSNNYDPQLTADGLNVMYTSDRQGGLGPWRIATALAGGIERLVVPRTVRMTTFGDSLTFGQGATTPTAQSWPAVTAAALGWALTNRGLQAYTSTSQAGLAGAIPTLVSVQNDSLLGSGATTTLLSINTYLLSAHNGSPTDSATRTITGSLVGQRGTLRRTPVGSAGSYTDLYVFISDTGSVTTPCPAGSVFFPDAPDQENEILGICLGTNTGNRVPESDATTKANVAALVAWSKPLYPKIMLFGLARASSFNAYWRTTFPQYYVVDSQGRDLYQRLVANSDGSEQDANYIAQGRPPYSLLSNPNGDYIHLNARGYAIWAELAVEVIQARNYHL